MADNQVPVVQDWGDEPLLRVEDLPAENVYIPPPVEQWCTCTKCHVWPSIEMNVCCRSHPIWETRRSDDMACITQCPNIDELLLDAPLRMMYHNYTAYHRPLYPDTETLQPGEQYTQDEIHKLIMAQKRLCAYRSLVFWAYPELRRGERRPLPSCVYLYIRARFQAEEDDEAWGDLQHSVFALRAANDDDI